MIQLKSLILQAAVLQSPMAGCTDLAFRLISRAYGMEFAFLEMVAAETLVRKHSATLRLLKRAPEDRPLGAQILGCKPEFMGEAASIIEEMGFDLVDINMGCPVPKVVAPGSGSALLVKPEKARAIFQSVTRNVKRIPVTVKMRKGFADPSGEEALKIARIAEDCGISAITIHGRTRLQGYSGRADWHAVGQIKKILRIPVFGNGDIMSGEDAVRFLKTSGCDGVMIGRGALGNPWIYRSIQKHMAGLASDPAEPPPTLEERKRALLKHFELEMQTEGEKIGLLKMRRIACWYFKNLEGNTEFRNRVNRCASTGEMEELINSFGNSP